MVRHLLGRGSLLSVMPTGVGKSSYQLPALLLPGRTVVVSPLVALMDDQVAALQSLNLPAEALHSHKDQEAQRHALSRFREGAWLYMSHQND